MVKTTFGGIFVGIVVLIALGTLPNHNSMDTNSAVQNAKESYATDTMIDASGQVMDQIAEQALTNSCDDPNSRSCANTKSSISIISIVWVIFIAVIVIEGLVGFSKWIVRTVEFVSDLF